MTDQTVFEEQDRAEQESWDRWNALVVADGHGGLDIQHKSGHEVGFTDGWAGGVRWLLEALNAEAEADMLTGGPIEGAHYRAIERRLAAIREAQP